MEETMFERIKQMTNEETKEFVYWVYMCGNEDGRQGLCDSESGFFSGYVLNKQANELMPNDSTDDLWDNFDMIYNKN